MSTAYSCVDVSQYLCQLFEFKKQKIVNDRIMCTFIEDYSENEEILIQLREENYVKIFERED